MPREEATEIEEPCIKLAEAAGWMHRKLDTGPGGKGWLDQIFILPKGCAVFVEFKTKNGKLSPKQRETAEELTARSHSVFVVRSTKEFRSIIDYFTES